MVLSGVGGRGRLRPTGVDDGTPTPSPPRCQPIREDAESVNECQIAEEDFVRLG